MANKNDASFMLVAAIDFGTTYSGYGFSFKDAPDDIKMAKNWGAEVGNQSYKTPTSLLVDKTGKFKGMLYVKGPGHIESLFEVFPASNPVF